MVIETNFERKAKNLHLAMGAVGPTICQRATTVVWKHIIEQTINGRYASVADYLVDLAIDAALKPSEPKNE